MKGNKVVFMEMSYRLTKAISNLKIDNVSSLIVTGGCNDLFLQRGGTADTGPIMSKFQEILGTVTEMSEKGIIVGFISRMQLSR
jgi:hypothetical protein